MPDDPAQAIFSMIDCLPSGIGCEEMFSQGICFCPFCGNQKVFAVPTFATAITWKSPEWNSTFETLKEAFPWRTNVSWHRADCDRDEVTVSVTKFGPWALLLFRPHDRTLYPPLQEMAIPLSDDSLRKEGLKIQGLMCTDIGGEHGRHFWFVEPTTDGVARVYDSLKGLQPLTLELSKTLHVVGLLVMSIDSDKPVLTNAKLCQAAGNVAVHQKRNKPINVVARAKRRAPRKMRTQRESKKSHVTRSDDGKRRQGSTPLKRGRTVTYLTAFRKQCVQDPEDPISDVESSSRPNKHMRSTPEKREQCQRKTSPTGKVKIAENKSACPDSCFERTDGQVERRSQKGKVNNADAQQETLGRAGKESPCAAKSNNQEEGKVTGCQQSKTVLIATRRHDQEKDQCSEPPSFPKGNYGVISLFDGVSSVVPALCRKLKRNPSVIVLAEVAPALRELVSFEFGYCRQETWQVAFSGCPSIYVKDVRRILEHGCLVLRQAHSIAPTAKWFIIGGSPCQDLTYAGPFHGLLGLTGPCSVLFFPFQRTIWTMQQLAGPDKVRYLAENAGSMDPIHFTAFCQLLKLDPKDPKEFLWDAFAYGAPIQRGRNLFRGHTDAEVVDLTAEYFPEGWGPLMDCTEKAVPLAPLLRTRSVEAFGIYRSSWTLYQPKALVWHYDFWEGRSNFCTVLNYVGGKLPNTRWENIIPPPFQEAWRAFLEELAKPKPSADKLDGHVQQLVPLFACATYEVPFRVVTPGEALKLSGLETHWKRTSIHDAENLPDNRIRDMCGNSFHPALICSALGETSILEKWIQGEDEQNQNAPMTRVATKAESHAVYAELVDKVAKRFAKDYPNKSFPSNRTLPELPDCRATLTKEERPLIAERQLPVYRKVNISKEKRDAQFRCDAAAKVLTGSECVALERAELSWIFESLRAAVHVPFDFPNLVRVLWGFSNLQHAASRLPDFPDFRRLTELQHVFQEAGTRPVSKAICVRVLLSLVELKQRAQWPLGIVYLSNREGTTDVLYLGVPAAKLVLLVRHMPQEEVDVWVAGASAYKTGMTTTTSVRMLRPFIARQINHDLCTDETCVEMRGGWNRLSILGHQCLTEHCPLCIMVQLGLCAICPWHLGRPFAMHDCLHLIGEVPANGQVVTITGHLNGYGGSVSLILLHVTHGMSELNSLQGFSEWKHHIQLDWVLPLLPNASTECDFGGPLLIPFSSHGLPSCFYEHLFVLPGGKNSRIQALLDEWGFHLRHDG